jgi:VIT1/CCC1 family predicted Fe2+/Mn2+ transporter
MDIKQRLAAHKAEDTHGSRLGPVIHDIVYGAHDGIVTTFAVVAGTVGADLPGAVILVLGAANLFADGFSMGAGAYLSARSAADQYARLRAEELDEIDRHPDMEREEIREAYEAKGFAGADLDRAVAVVTADKGRWADAMMLEEHGLSAPAASGAFVHGLATFLGFVVFGAVPLLPYAFAVVAPERRFAAAVAAAAVALLLVGVTRSYVTRQRPIRGIAEIMAIGAVSTAIAYGVGVALRGIASGAL